jgi:acetyl-CoA carboxylase biotin carboxylase subunit
MGRRGTAPVARIERILVANRGEIACRVLRTVRVMGLAGVAVYSDADATAPHVALADEAVRIGPAPSRESYLAADRIVEAARRVGADAVHPGYGFLSENAAFAERCADAGLTFIGPGADAIRAMGNKIEAKALMAKAGVPVLPGATAAAGAVGDVAAAARGLGFPILVKAATGGGGKGMRIVQGERELGDALAGARREAAAAFADDTLLLERYLESPRHVEVQVLADAAGTVVHCFERECSIQRRYQKIVEEAPSMAVDATLRERLGAAAVAAARAVGYRGAGTVEFLLDRDGSFYFLEMNTRLQVEHPVTEAITGLDLVRLQIEIARGEPLPFAQADLAIDGHAIEARLYAEDPARDFLPVTGRILLWEPAPGPGVRHDSGVARGSEVGVHYDPLLAKIIAHGGTRAEAAARLVSALRRLGIAGVTTNRDFLVATLTHPVFSAGALDTRFIERHLPAALRCPAPDPELERVHAVVATLAAHERRRGAGPLPPSIPSGWRNNRWRWQDVSYRTGDGTVEVRYVCTAPGRFEVECGEWRGVALVAGDAGLAGDARGAETWAVEIDGIRRRYTVVVEDDRTVVHGIRGTTEVHELPRLPARGGEEIAGGCLAPMTGVIREVRVAVGDRVERGAVLLVLEAMKMEHQMVAHAAGVVTEVRVEVGQMVDPDEVLIVVEPEAAVEPETGPAAAREGSGRVP